MNNRSENTDEECPSNDFKIGSASGSCWGDGHYNCVNCIHYRADFKRNGQDYIDYVYNLGTWRIEIL